MGDYRQTLQEEKEYLKQTLAFIQNQLEALSGDLSERKRQLIAARKDMWENTALYSSDYLTRLTEANQHLAEVNSKAAIYNHTLQAAEKYRRMMGSPYFGRLDFVEDGFEECEKIYIGLGNLVDPKTHDVYVYDWRAPIASIFYRYEPGNAAFQAPAGIVRGKVLLKRQYKIRDSQLKYFFDCSVTINDEILQEILSRNSSPKMRNIVSTIQKEQDLIIRDTASDLLIVQGVAGSGKTSIALHRVAFLLYDGLKDNLEAENVIILSPNAVFSSYISTVLPELGEANVQQATFNDIATKLFQGRFAIESREMQLETLIQGREKGERDVRRKGIDFKGSRAFRQILDRLLWDYAHRLLVFEDVYYNGCIIATRQQLKNSFLHNKTGLPMAKQLKRMENMLLDKVHPLQKIRRKKIEPIVARSDGHDLEIKSFSRLLAIKETQAFLKRLRRFTEVDYLNLYKMLFTGPELLVKLAQGLELPQDINEIIAATSENLTKIHAQKGGAIFPYEDCAPLLYLKLRLEGSDIFSGIKQVVIDEAQDYSPLQYEVFNLLFKDAKYTVLGDINQTVEKEAGYSLYDDVSEILNKEKTVKLFLNKGYRSSYEINTFTQKVLGKRQDFVSFERHEEAPKVVHQETPELMDRAVASDIAAYTEQGFESIAVICKTREEAERVYTRLKHLAKIKLLQPQDGQIEKGALVLPAYMAKGLEFDVVIVYDADKEHYASELDRKLLYIACTRALHRLTLYYTGEISPFLG